MTKLVRALGAAMLCLGLLSSASIIMATQDQAQPTKEAKKKEQKNTEKVVKAPKQKEKREQQREQNHQR